MVTVKIVKYVLIIQVEYVKDKGAYNDYHNSTLKYLPTRVLIVNHTVRI